MDLDFNYDATLDTDKDQELYPSHCYTTVSHCCTLALQSENYSITNTNMALQHTRKFASGN